VDVWQSGVYVFRHTPRGPIPCRRLRLPPPQPGGGPARALPQARRLGRLQAGTGTGPITAPDPHPPRLPDAQPLALRGSVRQGAHIRIRQPPTLVGLAGRARPVRGYTAAARSSSPRSSSLRSLPRSVQIGVRPFFSCPRGWRLLTLGHGTQPTACWRRSDLTRARARQQPRPGGLRRP
jgi:hypothetical protein